LEAVGFLETSIHIYQTTRRHIAEQRSLRCHSDCDFTYCICVVNICF